ncbi:MAG: thioredoxin family protein [Pseudomonadota bacterium]
MKLRIPTLLTGLLFLTLARATDTARDPAEYFFQETFGDFREELELARSEGKQGILLFFEQEECPFCHRMKTTVLNRSEVQDYFREHFRIFSVDIEGDLEITDFSGAHTTQKDFAFKQFNVRATPVFAFFDLDGKLIARHTGPTSDAREFLWLGEYVIDGHYRTESFTAFKRERRRQAASG